MHRKYNPDEIIDTTKSFLRKISPKPHNRSGVCARFGEGAEPVTPIDIKPRHPVFRFIELNQIELNQQES